MSNEWQHIDQKLSVSALPESKRSRIADGLLLGAVGVGAFSGVLVPWIVNAHEHQVAEPQPVVVAEATVRVISADPDSGLIPSKAVQRTVCKEVPDLIKQWQPVDGQGTVEGLEKTLTNECVGVANRLMDQSGGAQNLADKFLNVRLIDYSKGNGTPTIEVNIVE